MDDLDMQALEQDNEPDPAEELRGGASKSLFDEVFGALWNVVGSTERDQIIGLMSHARRIRLSPDLAQAVSRTMRDGLDTIESHLGYIGMNHPILWVEYPHAARSTAWSNVPGEADVVRDVGALITAFPDDPQKMAIFVAWRTSGGSVFHSYAMLYWDRADFLKCAANAQRGPVEEISNRLLELAKVSIPNGFREEMEVWQNVKSGDDHFESAVTQTSLNVVGEHIFLLTTMLLLSTPQIVETLGEDNKTIDVGLARVRSSRTGIGFRKLSWFLGGGLVWRDTNAAPVRLDWMDEHKRSQQLARDAEHAYRARDDEMALHLYSMAAENEIAILDRIEPTDRDNLGTVAVNAFWLLKMAERHADAASFGAKWIEDGRLPALATKNIQDALNKNAVSAPKST